MARRSMVTIATKKDDPTFVRVFGKRGEAEEFFGPKYNEKGILLTTVEKKTETYYEIVDDSDGGMALDATENGVKLNTTVEGDSEND